jgi:lysophospholipase L1-like esterase
MKTSVRGGLWAMTGLSIAIVVLILVQVVRIWQAAGRTDYGLKPFEQTNRSAQLNILFLGDSTIVGTGASSNRQSTAGWFGQAFPRARIDNFSLNGRKLDGLLRDYHPQPGIHYHLIVAQIGANDIMRLTPLSEIKTEINQLVDRLQPLTDTVVILHSGNVGLAPIFSWPFNEILAWRSRAVRQIYKTTAEKRGVLYVDLYTERRDDLFLKDINRYYSADHLHPSGDGYRYWYDRIRKTLNDAGVYLKD